MNNQSKYIGQLMPNQTLPAPLVPAECDLRNFTYMPLDVLRLRDSELAAGADGEVFRAAVLSWCIAWHQIPAASLPDDDAVLARLLGYGRDVKGWLKIRAEGALRGYVKCSDGRLYHAVVAEKAVEAWRSKLAQRDRTEKARAARLSHSLSQKNKPPVTETKTDPTGSVTENVTASKGEERRGEDIIEEDKSSSKTLPVSVQTQADTPPKPKKAPKPRPGYTPEFEAFWAAYPRKADKGHAAKAYQAAITRGTDHEAIIRGATAFAERCRLDGTEERFTPHAATWLNGDRWTDQPSQTLGQAPQRNTGRASILDAASRALGDGSL